MHELRYLTVGNPAAGSDFNFVASNTQRVKILTITATLATDATVANRVPAIQILSTDKTVVYDSASSLSQAASLTNIWTWDHSMSGPGFSGAYNGANVVSTNAFPDLILPHGWQVKVVTRLVDTSDQWSAIAVTYFELDGISDAQAGLLEAQGF